MERFDVNVDGQKKTTSGPTSKKFIHSPFFVNCEAQQGVVTENVKEVLVETDKENPSERLDWGLVAEKVGLRLNQKSGAVNWNCLADLPSGLHHWGMPYLILRVDDAAVDRRQSTIHLLITQPGPAKEVSSSDAATSLDFPSPAPAAPVVVGLIRFTGDVCVASSLFMEEKIEAFKKTADVTTLVILIDSAGGASVEGENLAALLLQRSLREIIKKKKL